jgi:serine/threonine protein phosphatase 1
MRSYAIGDIHGHLDLLVAAHARIAADRRRTGDHGAPVVHLGDLVDRGPDSRGVIEFLRRGLEAGAPWQVLKGNHDRMFSIYLRDPAARDPMLRTAFSYLHHGIGGAETLASYGIEAVAGEEADVHADALARVPEAHRRFLETRPALWQRGEAIFVHAGLRPGVPLEKQHEDDLIWIRGPFHEHAGDFGGLVVHGHTAIEAPTHYGNRVNIDSRAAYGGPLTAIVVEGRSVWVLEEDGRRPLVL